ncbi:peptide-methionine (S)-S-oxide reductase MsrA [Hymenobacter sp. BT683]|uniref:Peptide methionine sulfoxide reductase MsrA n=1 Tax=Hymenobacter jeongseonensis TaxID=2791027 RepID=A0ABS0IED8_9BACT|nr:peptide-methionine (S)-S-oxide reductase MsrA [Hymenobacter jeongseonensis]MBF9236333.1 peptide-methionine (S)-S-oxide reductase MsrA [Hymenobacter jeongseonensis]
MKNRLKSLASLSFLAFLFACGTQQSADAQNPPRSTAGFAPANLNGLAMATFAGGCFWAQEEAFEQLKGVKQVVSGYAGGTKANPTYEEVADKTTGHTETVQIYYDPKVISYQKLADIFFTASHDPTQRNGQGNDIGPEYRSAAFYRTPQEKKVLEATIARVNASKVYGGKIVTEVVPFKKFWPAEDYHQGYYRLHPENPYISNVSARKVEHVQKAFAKDLKSPL